VGTYAFPEKKRSAMTVELSQRDGDFIKKIFKEGRIACLTGAGISAESGIPTFRGKGGLWERYDPLTYAYTEGLLRLLRDQPEKLADFVADFYDVLLEARANAAHYCLAALEKEGILQGLITQNIDNLHQLAGTRRISELHGNAFRLRCLGCGHKISLERKRLQELAQLLRANRTSRIGLLKILSRYFCRCPSCHSRYRIDIVLFGEPLSQAEINLAYKFLDASSALMVIGCSLEVYPAASLPFYAKEKGLSLLEINSEKTVFSRLCDYHIRGSAAEILPKIMEVASS
jgi:NAD-dependent deacetylase